MRLRTGSSLAAALGLLIAAAISTGTDAAMEKPVADGIVQCTGTVTAVDPGSRRVRLVTGCGHALRTIDIDAGERCRVRVGGSGASLESLRRGQIATVRYRRTANRNTAESIVTPPGPDPGRQP